MKIVSNYFEEIVIVSAILLSYSFIPDYGSLLPKAIVFVVLLFSLFFMLLVKLKAYDYSLKISLTYSILIFLIVIMIYHQRWEDFSFIVKLLIAYLMVVFIKLDTVFDLMCKFSKLLFIPTVLGLVFGGAGLVLNVTGILSDGRELFLTPMLTSQKEVFFTRATSYFWEPGVFSFVLNLLIAYKLFRKKEKLNSIWREVVYLILAQSAGGILAFFLLIFSYFVYISKSYKFEVFTFFIGCFCTVVLFSDLETNIVFLTDILNFFTMFLLDRDLLTDPSFSARIVDFYVPFYAALGSPFFGYKDLDSFMVFSDLIRGFSAEGITNSWSSIAYRYGYPMMALYLFFMFLGTKYYFKSYLVPFVFIILLASSPVFLNIMTLFFVVGMFEESMKDKVSHNKYYCKVKVV